MRTLWCAVAAALAACSGGGDGGGDGAGAAGGATCASIGNVSVDFVQGDCGDCLVRNTDAVADGDLFSAALIQTGPSSQQLVRLRGGSGVFPAGSRAGAFLTLQGAQNHLMAFNLYLAGALVQTAPDPVHNLLPTAGGTGAETFVTFETLSDFDEVELVLSVGGSGETLADEVFEICADGDV